VLGRKAAEVELDSGIKAAALRQAYALYKATGWVRLPKVSERLLGAAEIKAWIRRYGKFLLCHGYPSSAIVYHAFQTVTAAKCRGWIAHAGSHS